MSRGRIILLSALAVAVLVAAVLGFGAWRGWFAKPSVDDPVEITLPKDSVRPIATNLRAPWGLAFLPDGRALVTERDTARILSVSGDGQVSEVQTLSEVRPGGEGGLLGIAVSPTYATDQWVYVYYTSATDNRIARLHLGGAPEPILTGIPKAGNHNGGRLAFGPDAMLYAGTGDAGDRDKAQDVGYLGGKILRITPDGKAGNGNPFGNSPVWTLGHRNVQGLGWDDRGRMYAAEFGQNQYDELNRIEAGKNYGWPIIEGTGRDQRFVDPIATWATNEASPSGIAVVGDRVWIACLRGQRVYRIGTDGSAPEQLFTGDYGRLRHVGRAPDGSMWVLTSNRDSRGRPSSTDDRILRVTP